MRTLSFLLALVFSATAAFAQTGSAVITHSSEGFVLATPTDAPVTDASAVLLIAPSNEQRGWMMRTLNPGDRPADILARGLERRAHHQMALKLRENGANRHGIVSAYHRDRIERRRTASGETMDIIGDGEIIDMDAIDTDMDDVIVGDGEIIDEDIYEDVYEGDVISGRMGSRAVLQSIRTERRARRSVQFQVTAQIEQALDMRDPLLEALASQDALAGLQVETRGGETHLEIVFDFDSTEEWKTWMEAHAATINAIRDRDDDATIGLKLDVR